LPFAGVMALVGKKEKQEYPDGAARRGICGDSG